MRMGIIPDVISLTRKLLSFNTVNPPGRETPCVRYIGGSWRKAGSRPLIMPFPRTGRALSPGLMPGPAGRPSASPAAGFVGPLSAALIGLAAGVVCYYGILAKKQVRLRRQPGRGGHPWCRGVLGLIATGLLATKLVNPGAANGLFFGNPSQLGIQCLAVFVTIGYAFGAAFYSSRSSINGWACVCRIRTKSPGWI